MKTTVWFIILAINCPLFALGQSNSVSGLQFYSASPEGRQISFTPPVDVDWEALMPDSIRYLVDNKDREKVLQQILDRSGMFGAIFEFTQDIPVDIPQRWYYLLSPEGFFPVSLKAVKGRVRFRTYKGRITSINYSGDLIGAFEGDPPELNYGFVVLADSRLHENITPGSFSADELKADTSYFMRGTDFWGIRDQYMISFDGVDTRYAFVQWVPDSECFEACCEIRLSLFRMGDPNVSVHGNNFRCDI